jgi:hypothetical protein
MTLRCFRADFPGELFLVRSNNHHHAVLFRTQPEARIRGVLLFALFPDSE